MKKRALTLVGAVWVLRGLAVALITNHYETTVMGQANLGIAVLVPKEGRPEWEAKQRLRTEIEWLFWVGLALTAGGVALQTAGALREQ
jgi:hypothetical protein